MNFDANIYALLISALASGVIGMLWYSPLLFGKQWIQHSGISPDVEKPKMKEMVWQIATSFIAAFVTAFVFLKIAAAFSITNAAGAIQLAFLVWLGFQATLSLNVVLWERKPWVFYLINVSYQLVALIAVALIVVLWV